MQSKSEHLHTPLQRCVRQTRRQIFLSRSPVTLLFAEREFQRPSLREELMTNPIPSIRLPIQCRILNIYPLVLSIEISVANSGRLIRECIRDASGLEEGWDDKVDILPRVRK